MSRKHIIKVESKTPPIVEMDTAARAAYIRFSNEKVQRTEVVDVEDCLVTIDIDDSGDVIGVELLGVSEFKIDTLLKQAGVRGVSSQMMRETSYIPAAAHCSA